MNQKNKKHQENLKKAAPGAVFLFAPPAGLKTRNGRFLRCLRFLYADARVYIASGADALPVVFEKTAAVRLKAAHFGGISQTPPQHSHEFFEDKGVL